MKLTPKLFAKVLGVTGGVAGACLIPHLRGSSRQNVPEITEKSLTVTVEPQNEDIPKAPVEEEEVTHSEEQIPNVEQEIQDENNQEDGETIVDNKKAEEKTITPENNMPSGETTTIQVIEESELKKVSKETAVAPDALAINVTKEKPTCPSGQVQKEIKTTTKTSYYCSPNSTSTPIIRMR